MSLGVGWALRIYSLAPLIDLTLLSTCRCRAASQLAAHAITLSLPAATLSHHVGPYPSPFSLQLSVVWVFYQQ